MIGVHKRLISLILLVTMVVTVGMPVFAYNNSEYIVLCGFIESRAKGVSVAITVYAPGKNENDITGDSLEDVVSCITEVKTIENGSYKTRFKPTHGYGNYTAYIRAEDSDKVEIRTITYRPPKTDENYNDYVVINDFIESRKENVSVAVTVYAPGKNENDIISGSLENVVSCITEVKTDKDGRYRVRFKAKHGYGDYTAYIRAEDSDKIEIKTVNHMPPISIDSVYSNSAENIFTDVSLPKFYINITNGLETEEEITLNYTVFENDISIYNGTEKINLPGSSLTSKTVELSHNRYGTFDILFEIPELYESKKVTFSKIMTSDNKTDNIGVKAESTDNEMVPLLGYLGASFVKEPQDGVETPQDALDGEVAIDVKSKEIGRIYYDEDCVNVNVLLKNNGNNFNGTILWNVYNDKSKIACGENSIGILGGEEINVPLEFGTDEFGFFSLSVEILDESRNLVSRCKPFRFSVANAPKNGVKNKNMGVNVHATPDQITTEGDPATNMMLAAKAGFSFIRNEVWWRYYEKSPGVYAFPKDYAKAVQAAHDLDLEIAPILTFGNPIYQPYEHPPASPEILDAFGKFGVNYKRDLGSLTKEVSVWNEYNHPGFNQDSRPAESYADMLKEVYTHLKADNHETFVWGLVTAGIPISFIRRVLNAGGGEYMDGFDVHYYTYESTPEKGGILKSIADLKALMKQYGYEDKPIYISENGWCSTGTGDYSDAFQQACYNVRMQFLVSAYDLADKYAYYKMNDGAIEDGEAITLGIVKSAYAEIPYEAKPAYLAISNYNALMTDSEFVEMLTLDSDVTAYRYKLANGKDCFAVWSLSGNNEKTFNLGTEAVTLCDMYGNEKTLQGADGNFTLTLTEEPIYVMGKFGSFKKGTKQYESFADELEKINISVDNAESEPLYVNNPESLIKTLAENAETSEKLLIDVETREAYTALATYNALTGGMSFKEKTQTDSVSLYNFSDKDGNEMNILWGSGDTYPVSISDAKQITVYDIFGNASYVNSENGVFNLPTQNTPVYFAKSENSITVSNDKGAVKYADDINVGDNVRITVKTDKSVSDDNMVIAAGYQRGRLEFINIRYMENGVNEDDFSFTAEDSYDEVKVFIWKKYNLSPITHLTLKKKEV